MNLKQAEKKKQKNNGKNVISHKTYGFERKSRKEIS